MVVAAYNSPKGCILSPSIEAKCYGIKTGMRVMDAQKLYADVLVLPTDPWKYRWVNQQLKLLFNRYTNLLHMKSIDEAVLYFTDAQAEGDLTEIALDIKRRIRQDIGDWLTVSVGIGPNSFLAKTGAGLHKPDGLDEINWWNIEQVLASLKLEDLNGISRGHARQLRRAGLLQPLDMYRADADQLRLAFKSILGVQWYWKLRGYEAATGERPRRSFSHMYSLPHPVEGAELEATISKMGHSLAYRLRRSGWQAKGFYLGTMDTQFSYWARHTMGQQYLYDGPDLHRRFMWLLQQRSSRQPVRKLFTGCFGLEPLCRLQTTWLDDELRKRRKVEAVTEVQARYGKFSLMPARMLQVHQRGWVKDAISFGGIGELDDAPEEQIEDYEVLEAMEALFSDELLDEASDEVDWAVLEVGGVAAGGEVTG